jgi:hypothetical protein
MIILEPFLARGNVCISARHGLLFKATFIPRNGNAISQESDRGFDHLTRILAAAISGDNKIRDDANTLYQYPLSFSNECRIERYCRHAFVEMRKGDNGFFEVKIKKIQADPSPGYYCRKGKKPRLDDAFEAALLGTPVLIV